MNILMISKIDISRPNGETEHFLGLAKGFAKSGHNVTILLPEPSSKTETSEIQHRYIKATRCKYKSIIFQLLLIFYLPFFLLSHKIDIIYIRQGPFLVLPSILSRLLGYRTITEINGLLQEDMKIIHNPPEVVLRVSEICERLSYYFSNKIISVTLPLKNFIKKKYKIKDNKIIVISNGVDYEYYHIKKKKHTKFNVLFMGGSAKWQGLDILLKAIDFINEMNIPVNFIIITDIPIHKKNTESYVNMDRKSILDILSFTDIAIAPYTSFRNNISGISPIKIYTYLSAGIPVIISDIGEISRGIESSNAGYSIKSDNPELLAKKIQYVYNNRNRIVNMSGNASGLAKKYDWKIIASKIIDFMYN